MAGSVNKVIIIGNLGQDPEVRATANGTAVASFSVATNERWKDAQGAKQEHVEWHRVTLWGKLAELAGQYLAKGRAVYVEGRLQTRKWQDKGGQERWSTEIVARELVFLDSADGAGKGGRRPEPPPDDRPPIRNYQSSSQQPPATHVDDDIPF